MFTLGARKAHHAAVTRRARERDGFLPHPARERVAQASIPVQHFAAARVIVDDFREPLRLRPDHHRLRFGLGRRGRPLVGVGRRAGAARARGRPALRVVAVLIDARTVRERPPVLAPHVARREHEVVAIRVPDRCDPDLVAIDDCGDPRIGAITGGEMAGSFQRDDRRADFPRVMRRDDQHRGLVFVRRHVIRDFQGEEVSSLDRRRRAIGRRDVDDLCNLRMRGGYLLHPKENAVQIRVPGRHALRERGVRKGERDQRKRNDESANSHVTS